MGFGKLDNLVGPDIGIAMNKQNGIARPLDRIIHLNTIDRRITAFGCLWHGRRLRDHYPAILSLRKTCKSNKSNNEETQKYA
jgi:hypothetical protein